MNLKKAVVSFYLWAVNFNQWFQYGSDWLLLPLTVLSITSNFSVLLLFLGIQGTVVQLIYFTGIITVVFLVVGFILFRSGAQMIEIIMSDWRLPLPNLQGVANDMIMISLAKEHNLPVPDALKKWGLKDWEDLKAVVSYSLEKGEKARALSMCKDFFESERKRQEDKQSTKK